MIGLYEIISTSVSWDKQGNPADYLTDPICIAFRGFNLKFAGVGVQMGPPFVVISLPSVLQREDCANGSMHFDGRDDNDDDEQVIRMN